MENKLLILLIKIESKLVVEDWSSSMLSISLGSSLAQELFKDGLMVKLLSYLGYVVSESFNYTKELFPLEDGHTKWTLTPGS